MGIRIKLALIAGVGGELNPRVREGENWGTEQLRYLSGPSPGL